MRSLFFIILLVGFGKTFGQNRTVYIVKNDSIAKKPQPKEHQSLLEYTEGFSQIAASLPLRYNPEYGKASNQNPGDEDKPSQYLPGGLSIHGGTGWHINQTVALTANTGFDWHMETGLFSVPVYASAMANLYIVDDISLLFQYGLGYTFAIGQGDLSGLYQKFRIGLCVDILGFYAEINNYGYPWKEASTMASINFGVAVQLFH